MRYIEHVEAKFVKSDCRLLAFKAFSELKLLFSIESSHELLKEREREREREKERKRERER